MKIGAGMTERGILRFFMSSSNLKFGIPLRFDIYMFRIYFGIFPSSEGSNPILPSPTRETR